LAKNTNRKKVGCADAEQPKGDTFNWCAKQGVAMLATSDTTDAKHRDNDHKGSYLPFHGFNQTLANTT
jgi:hypothetical protein